jgi:hypothetical protein
MKKQPHVVSLTPEGGAMDCWRNASKAFTFKIRKDPPKKKKQSQIKR